MGVVKLVMVFFNDIDGDVADDSTSNGWMEELLLPLL